MLSPDWKVLTDLLAQKVEPNASITGSLRVAHRGNATEVGYTTCSRK